MAFGNIVAVVLAIATIIGGLAGADWFREKWNRNRGPNTLVNPNREEILRVVLESNSRDDWIRTQTQTRQTVSYRHNPNLRFEHSLLEDGFQNEHFREAWANRHPDPDAAGYWYDLLFGPTLIQRFILVGVDGVRALIPPPSQPDGTPGGNTIQRLPLQVARIHDSMRTLDEYIRRSGLEVSQDVRK